MSRIIAFIFWLIACAALCLAQQAEKPSLEAAKPAEVRLALTLLAASTDAARQALLDAEPQLITRRFRHVLAMEVIRCQLRAEHTRVLATLEFIRRFAEARGDRGWVAMTWVDSMGTYDLMGQPLKVLAAYRKIPPLKELESDPLALAHVSGLLGFILRLNGNLDAAWQASQRALRLFEPDQQLERGMAHCVSGMILLDQEKFVEAEQSLNAALQIFNELGDRFWTAIPLHYLGEVALVRGEARAALTPLQQSAALNAEFDLQFLRYFTLTKIGRVYRLLGDYANEVRWHEQSLIERERLGDQRKISTALLDLAEVHTVQNNYGKAFEYAERALRLCEAVPYHEGISRALRQMGDTFGFVENFGVMLDYYQRALKAAQAASSANEVAKSWEKSAIVHKFRREFALAQAALQQSLQASGKDAGIFTQLNLLMEKASLHRLQGQPAESLASYRQTLALLEKVYRPFAHMTVLSEMGVIFSHQGEYAEALRHYQQALPLAEKFYPPQSAALHTGIGTAQHALKQNDAALVSFQAAIAAAENVRTQVAGTAQWNAIQLNSEARLRPYLEMVDMLNERGQFAEALHYAERSKARALLELLAEARTDIRAGVNPELLERERRAQSLLNALAAQQLSLTNDKRPIPASLTKEITVTTAELQQLEAELRAHSPHYAALAKPQPLTTATIQRQLLDEDTLLLEYVLGETRSWVFAVTPNAVMSFALPPRAEIEKQVEALRRAFNTAPTMTNGANPAAAQLSRTLLAPVAAQLGQKRLVIVAAGALQYVPFAALSAGRVPLVANHEIVYLPSASTLAVLRRERGNETKAAQTIAVFADPVFSAQDERVKTSSAQPSMKFAPKLNELRGARGDFRRLHFSRNEADAIKQAAPQAVTWQALDFEASRTSLLQRDLREFRFLHFATHGVLDNERPELSGIVLSLVDRAGQPQDGLLRLHEIYNLKLQSELVVLSACQTALGQDIRGEGLIGLTRGFIYAGAPRVVASLWQVDDVATAELMKRFYRGMLQQGLRPAAALRAAQLDLSRNPRWRAPFYWAAFTLQGEWR